MDDRPFVSVLCLTYNHKYYIKKCLDSILGQNTNFHFEVIVHDDASTDGTIDILKKYEEKYVDKIRVIYEEENSFDKGEYTKGGEKLIRSARGKYLAHCEGDDFWTRRDKLQKQVDFLEVHKEYSMCIHAAYIVNEAGRHIKGEFMRPYDESGTITTEEILFGWKFATASIVNRRDLLPAVIPYRKNCLNGDITMCSWLAFHGKVYYMDDFMSAYRINSISSVGWRFRTNIEKHVMQQKSLASMYERMDEYTDGRYHRLIQNAVDAINFNIAVDTGDVRTAKSLQTNYKKMGKRRKLFMYMEYLVPGSISIYRNMKANLLHKRLAYVRSKQ